MILRRITEGGTVVGLTRKEYDLLLLFEENAGKILSRQFLLTTVWGYRETVITRTLDVHVTRLRRKLAREHDLQIHTILGNGYLLEWRTKQALSATAAPVEVDRLPIERVGAK